MSRALGCAERVITWLRGRASALVIGLSLATVAATTGFISYTHISALTVHEHQSWKSAHLYPLAVDGQIAVGTVVLMEVKGPRRWLGLLGFAPGLAESLVANWASGWQGHDLGAALWATVPAQAFACSTFLFEAWLRYRRSLPAADAATETAGPAEEPPSHEEPSAPGHRPPAVSARRVRPAAADDTRTPLPEDEEELAALVRSLPRNHLFRDYQVSKTGADKLKARFPALPDETAEEAQEDAA